MNVKIILEMNCTTVPKKKAIATERKIPRITDRAFSVLRSSLKPRSAPPAIFIRATTNVAQSSSNTMETVVDVGIPSELKMSRRMMSVTITAMKMQMRS